MTSCKHSVDHDLDCDKCEDEYEASRKPPVHEIYPRIGTSDRQRAYLAKHGIKHIRKDGEYR